MLAEGMRVRLAGVMPGYCGVIVALPEGRPPVVAVVCEPARGRYGERGAVPEVRTFYVARDLMTVEC